MLFSSHDKKIMSLVRASFLVAFATFEVPYRQPWLAKPLVLFFPLILTLRLECVYACLFPSWPLLTLGRRNTFTIHKRPSEAVTGYKWANSKCIEMYAAARAARSNILLTLYQSISGKKRETSKHFKSSIKHPYRGRRVIFSPLNKSRFSWQPSSNAPDDLA